MTAPTAEALAEFRAFNYERIYLRPASVAQGQAVVRVLRALVEHFADRPNTLPFPELAGSGHPSDGSSAGSGQAVREAVTYVAGMTDRFAFSPGGRASRLGPRDAARRARCRDRPVNVGQPGPAPSA